MFIKHIIGMLFMLLTTGIFGQGAGIRYVDSIPTNSPNTDIRQSVMVFNRGDGRYYQYQDSLWKDMGYMRVVDSTSQILNEKYSIGERILNRVTGATYNVLPDSIAGYVNDSIAVTPLDTGYAVLQSVNGEYDIRWFGAIQDDAILDRISIQKAFDYAVKDSFATIFVDEGVYELDSYIYVLGQSNLTLKGSGTLKMADGSARGSGINASGAILRFDSTDYLTIEGLTLDANIANRTNDLSDQPAHNLRLRGTDHVTIRNVTFPSSISDGIAFQKYNDDIPEDILIDNVNIQQFWRSGISVINGINVKIVNSTFSNPQSGALGGGINLEPNSGELGFLRDVKISNSTFQDSLRYGVQVTERGEGDLKQVWIDNCTFKTLPKAITGSGGVKISNNNFLDIYSTTGTDNAIDIRGAAGTAYPEVIVDNNIFVNLQNRAMYSNGDVRRVVFTNNRITSSGLGANVPAINLYADTSFVENNKLFDNYWGIALYDATETFVSENKFDYTSSYSVYLNNVTNTDIRNNYFKQSNIANTSRGFLYFTGVDSAIVQSNHFDGTSGFTAIEDDDNTGMHIYFSNVFNGFTNNIRFDNSKSADAKEYANVIDKVLTNEDDITLNGTYNTTYVNSTAVLVDSIYIGGVTQQTAPIAYKMPNSSARRVFEMLGSTETSGSAITINGSTGQALILDLDYNAQSTFDNFKIRKNGSTDLVELDNSNQLFLYDGTLRMSNDFGIWWEDHTSTYREVIEMAANGVMIYRNQAGTAAIQLNQGGYIQTAGEFRIDSGTDNGDYKLQVAGNVFTSGGINAASLPTYADDTAAGVGGLVAGDLYKTATGELRIKL